MSYLCIYHKNCADGFGAAIAVKQFCEQHDYRCEFLAAQFGDDIPDVSGKQVLIVDFSYPRETLLAMKAQATSLRVIDHHKTAEEDLAGLDFCVFNMDKSGAVLTWETLLPDRPVPLLLAYIQDRDIWLWQLEHSKAVSAALHMMKMEFAGWEKYLDDAKIPELITMGQPIVTYQDQQIAKAAKGELPMANIAGYDVPCINITQLQSEIGNIISAGHPFAAMYKDVTDKRVYSLRSTEQGIDVALIAKKFGGGGHKHAAGFSVAKPEVDLSLK